MRRTITIFLIFILISGIPIKGISMDRGQEADTFWTILEYYPVNMYSCGLAWDGTYFYLGSYSNSYGSEIHRFDPSTGQSELLFNGPQTRAFGLTWDGQYLWLIDRIPPSSTLAFAMQIDLEGNIISQFDLPAYYMSGIAWDNGNFWVNRSSPNPGQVMHINGEGEVLSSFTAPDNLIYDIALDGDFLWYAENQNNKIYKTDLQGNLLETHQGRNQRAAGIVHDGQYLWYVARMIAGPSFIYKVDPQGSGTPVLQIDNSVNFGNIIAGNSDNKNLTITNPGQGVLIIEDLYFGENNTGFSVNTEFPLGVQPGSSSNISVSFSPGEIGVYEELATLITNDPFQLTKQISFSGKGLSADPYLVSAQDLINFNVVRLHSSNRAYLQLTNMGNIRVRIESIDFPAHYYLDNQVSFPLDINPTQQVNIPFWFRPSHQGDLTGYAQIVFNNPEQSPFEINLKGISQDTKYQVGESIWHYRMPGNPDNARAILSIPDITGDGINDVVVSTRGENFYCFAGNSSGEASLIWSLKLGTVEYPRAIALLDDINGDGVQDFVAGTSWSDRAITAISSRTGEILWRYNTNQFGGGGWVYMVDVKYDYNNNGYRDVLAAVGDDGDGNGPRRVMLLNGKTGQIIWTSFLNGAAFSVIGVEDFNGDGVPDVVAGATSANGSGRVFGINGATGAIIWQYNTTSGSSVWALEQTGDLTGNGIKDIIAGTYYGNGSYYLMNATNGSILYHGTLGNSLILDMWNAGDLNGDGFDDFIPAYTSVNNAVAISGQTGELLWTTPIADQPWSVAPLGDITGDGVNDVAIGTLFSDNRVYFFDGSNGQIIEWVAASAAVDVLTAIPDITRDNSTEVVAGTRDRFIRALSGGTAVAPIPYEVTFRVSDGANPPSMIDNAVIVITETGNSATTNTGGQAYLDLIPGVYSYTVSREDYNDAQGTFRVEGQDKVVEIVLTSGSTNAPEVFDPMVVAFRNFPNPFSAHTNISFTLTRPSEVSIVVYDMNARAFHLVKDQFFGAGENTIQWQGTDNNGNLLQNGIYFLEFRTSGNFYREKVVIFR